MIRKPKLIKLTWNVYRYDINHNVIRTFNIFDHGSFNEDVRNLLKKTESKETFAEELKKELGYYFWGKCEYEICISGLFSHSEDTRTKIDVYMQVMQNYDIFVDYVWNNGR